MKVRALVIDDSRVMRTMVMGAVNRTNLAEFEFTEAEDGVDGLSKFDAKKTDLVFVDWNMPKMTGIEFVRRVRAMPTDRHVAIIMVTSERTAGKMDEALDGAGADSYICKPFTVVEMERKLAKYIAALGAKDKPSAGGFFTKLMGTS